VHASPAGAANTLCGIPADEGDPDVLAGRGLVVCVVCRDLVERQYGKTPGPAMSRTYRTTWRVSGALRRRAGVDVARQQLARAVGLDVDVAFIPVVGERSARSRADR
jgi:hypothetical protein